MISSFFISLGTALLSGLVAVLPTASLPAAVLSAIETIGTSLNAFSFIVPVATIFAVFSFVLGFEILWFAFWGFVWIWKRLPIIGK